MPDDEPTIQNPGRLMHEFRRIKRNNRRLRDEKAELRECLTWLAECAASPHGLDVDVAELRIRLVLDKVRAEKSNYRDSE